MNKPINFDVTKHFPGDGIDTMMNNDVAYHAQRALMAELNNKFGQLMASFDWEDYLKHFGL